VWAWVPVGFHGAASPCAGRGSGREGRFAVTVKSKVEGRA